MKTENIGNARGRIALYLDYDEAMDLASHFRYPDTGGTELVEAASRAYPERVEAEERANGTLARDPMAGCLHPWA